MDIGKGKRVAKIKRVNKSDKKFHNKKPFSIHTQAPNKGLYKKEIKKLINKKLYNW